MRYVHRSWSSIGCRRPLAGLLLFCLVFLPAPLPAAPPAVITTSLGLTLRLIPGGKYTLGSPPTEAGRYWHEGPQHSVFLSTFYITTHEITNAQYAQFLAATGHPAPLYWRDKNLNGPNLPVVGVTWHDAVAFAEWLSRLTGTPYRLPTEAQWEAAARAGLVGQPFPWGSQPPNEDGRFRGNYNPNPYDQDGFRYSAPVGSFPANNFGLFDMAGNVAEWCGDWYDPKAYQNRQVVNPTGPPTGTYRVIRGGSWYDRARELRCAARQFSPPYRADGFIGFRLVQPIAAQ